tara:strand:+ start:1804 stop:2700 length:897 start_codon:yes stop_codon:yes gene_type:complete
MSIIFHTNLRSLPLINRGKVRDNYEISNESILIITTDRVSAFDEVLKESIPLKGKILNQLSKFWFRKFNHIVPNHLKKIDPELVVFDEEKNQVIGRSVVVKRLKPIAFEAIVRGYLSGSAWNEYKKKQSVSGILLPNGLKISEKLPEPIFTPSTKADIGSNDININFQTMKNKIGKLLADQIREISINLYLNAANYALGKGIIIADTKFEFGLDGNENLFLIDEVLTPDSSRFWPIESYTSGIIPISYDKQFIRDYLKKSSNYNKTKSFPTLSSEVIHKTTEKYCEVYKRLTGDQLEK